MGDAIILPYFVFSKTVLLWNLDKSPVYWRQLPIRCYAASMNNLSNIEEYVSHFSAAKLWSIPNLDLLLDAGHTSGCECCQLIDRTVNLENCYPLNKE